MPSEFAAARDYRFVSCCPTHGNVHLFSCPAQPCTDSPPACLVKNRGLPAAAASLAQGRLT